jgi:hypothetical protein
MKLGFEDEIGPFALLNRFSDEWIVSRRASILFLVAVPLVLALTPIFFGWVNVSRVTIWTQLFGGLLGALGPIALFFLWFGMWRYWVRLDNSSARKKKIWFAVLLLGLWYGSVLYYFLVYRPQISRKARGGT